MIGGSEREREREREMIMTAHTTDAVVWQAVQHYITRMMTITEFQNTHYNKQTDIYSYYTL